VIGKRRSGWVMRASTSRTLQTIMLLGVGGCAAGGGGSFSGRGSLFGAKGAPWTIRCAEQSGPARRTRIAQLATTLKRTPGIRAADVFVFGDHGTTGLYYGRYRRATDRKTGKRNMPAQMRADLNLIKQLGDANGKRYFLTALPARVPTPNVGDPAWDLRNVASAYSLQVAVFEPSDDFWEWKQAAVNYCEFLRKKGFEAYYHHDSASSVVTVGQFGADAVVTKMDGRRYYSDQVGALQKNELLRYNFVNGGIMYVIDDDGTRNAVPSFLVEVPHDDAP